MKKGKKYLTFSSMKQVVDKFGHIPIALLKRSTISNYPVNLSFQISIRPNNINEGFEIKIYHNTNTKTYLISPPENTTIKEVIDEILFACDCKIFEHLCDDTVVQGKDTVKK